MNQPARKIIHVDMDAFYASVEQRDNPALRGKPVVVGGPPNSRSVVCAASYEARKFGVRSAIPCSQAERLCPQAIFVQPRFEAYRAVSKEIMEIFQEYTDLVEPLSLDEAFLDVTENKMNNPSATWIAEEIRQKILRRTTLTASAGVAPNKFLAKVASDLNKPNGLTVISPEKVLEILQTLPIRKVPGVGKVTEEKLKSLGIHTTWDLRQFSEEKLRDHFGKMGGYFARIAEGIDHREVCPSRTRKSVGVEDTFAEDILDKDRLREEMRRISEKVWQRLHERPGRTVTVKVTYDNFEKATRSKTLPEKVQNQEELLQLAWELFDLTSAGIRPIRLVGISVSHFEELEKKAEMADDFPKQLTFPFSGKGN